MMTSLVSSAVVVSFHRTFQKTLINQTVWAVENMSYAPVALVAILEIFLPCQSTDSVITPKQIKDQTHAQNFKSVV